MIPISYAVTRRAMVLGFGLVITTSSLGARAEDQRVACVGAAEQAQAFRTSHNLRSARERLLVCANDDCPAVVRTDCARWLTEVDAAMPSIVIKAYDPAGADLVSVVVFKDGVKLMDQLDGLAHPVDPGVSTFRFEAAGMLPVEQRVVIREGEKQRGLVVKFTSMATTTKSEQLEPPHADASGKESHSVIPYVLAGVGVVALGSFAYFGINGRSEASDLADGCGATKSCRESQVAPVRRKLLIADLSLTTGLISLGISTYWFVSRKPSRKSEAPVVQVSRLPGGGSLAASWRF